MAERVSYREPSLPTHSFQKQEQLSSLEEHRKLLEDHFCHVGSSFLGTTKSYCEIVSATARKIGAQQSAGATTSEMEKAIVSQVWEQTRERMTEEQRVELECCRIKELAKRLVR